MSVGALYVVPFKVPLSQDTVYDALRPDDVPPTYVTPLIIEFRSMLVPSSID